MSHAERYFSQVVEVAQRIDFAAVERIAVGLAKLRERGGRLFLLGVGGSAANCAHAVNDFRKITGIEAYSPCDNVAELTARTNDDGWETVFVAWLRGCNATSRDGVMVLSVGGGSAEHNISPNIVRALQEARTRGLTIYGIVGRDGGYTKQVADEVVLVPTVDPELITPHAESFQAVVWHCLVCHPALQLARNTWEAIHARPAA
jgi:D-sedoheptulose 7-phosphate isomerase